MNILIRLRTPLLCFMALTVAAMNVWAAPESSPLELWYDQPAKFWTAALPIGNGRMGAMDFGGVSESRFQFNEDSLWTGGPHSYAHRGAAEVLPQIRQLLFDGKQREAEELASRRFMSRPLRQHSYQPFGDVTLKISGIDSSEAYRRSLDLSSAISTTRFRSGGVSYSRRAFASFPDQVIVIQVECDAPGKLEFSATLNSPQPGSQTSSVDGATLLLAGQARPLALSDQRAPAPTRFGAHLRVASTDGSVESIGQELHVTGASRATLLLSAATSFVNFRDVSADPIARSIKHLEAATTKSFDSLLRAHVRDHGGLFNRVSLEIDGPYNGALATDERVLASDESPDPQLAALFFHYGRYLMIASSRPGGQPANLQGLWNAQLEPAWDSKYTVNINTEMNYWPTEPCNLGECAQPLFAAMAELAQSGAETAREHYAAPGWVLHHNFDLWRGTAPINASDHGIWPMGGAWLCSQLWEHYLYTGDLDFLQDQAYPLMRGAAAFVAHSLVEDPRDPSRRLISGPSNSPEQGGLVMGPTMDHQIARELFANTIEASETLGIDAELRSRLQEMRSRIAPNQIGKHGQLQEWLEDVDDPANEHRHVSHLWGLYPGSEINAETPELFAAARQSLEHRGDGGTGWSRAWKINFWARLQDGDRANKVLDGLLTLTESPKTSYRGGGVYTNLFDAHPPFQIDGNFGATAAVCEMLLQSHRRTEEGVRIIELLPALPTAWPAGRVVGLRARDGFEVDTDWHGGRMSRALVRSHLGRPALLRLGDELKSIHLAAGESVELDGRLAVQPARDADKSTSH